MAGGVVFFIYFPAIFGFIGILLIASGIMDDKFEYTIGGIALFFAAGILPFLILPAFLGI